MTVDLGLEVIIIKDNRRWVDNEIATHFQAKLFYKVYNNFDTFHILFVFYIQAYAGH